MKKYLLLATTAMVAMGFTGCAGGSEKTHGDLTKLTDYLYEVTYTDLNDSLIAELSDSAHAFIKVEGACSSVRNGNFYGRNLDLFYNDGCEVVVHMEKSENRLASVAVCGGKADITAEVLEKADEKLMQRLPFIVLDGINECGVTCNVNVVPGEDTAPITGTNPGKENLACSMALRYILDRAKTAKEAVELLENRNLLGSFGHLGLHYMIADAKETYIVEFVDNKMQYVVSEPVCDTNVMTNLYSTLLPKYTPHANGIERYAIL